MRIITSSDISPYVAAKHYADEWLKSTDLDYTNEKGKGNVKVATKLEIGEVPREDVAGVILQTIDDPALIGKEFQVVSGNTPIQAAFQSIK